MGRPPEPQIPPGPECQNISITSDIIPVWNFVRILVLPTQVFQTVHWNMAWKENIMRMYHRLLYTTGLPSIPPADIFSAIIYTVCLSCELCTFYSVSSIKIPDHKYILIYLISIKYYSRCFFAATQDWDAALWADRSCFSGIEKWNNNHTHFLPSIHFVTNYNFDTLDCK